MSVIAGWSIYEGLLTNILQTQKMEKKRNRKPNWTEEQGLLLAQLVNEHELLSHYKSSSLLLADLALGALLSARNLEE